MASVRQLVQFDQARDGVNVKISYERDRTISFFSIDRVVPSDSGEYFCDPDGLSQVKVILHVLNGKRSTGGMHSPTKHPNLSAKLPPGAGNSSNQYLLFGLPALLYFVLTPPSDWPSEASEQQFDKQPV